MHAKGRETKGGVMRFFLFQICLKKQIVFAPGWLHTHCVVAIIYQLRALCLGLVSINQANLPPALCLNRFGGLTYIKVNGVGLIML